MSAEERSVLYLDASALVKLVLPEAESAALVAALAGGPRLITSAVGAIETRRALLAASDDPELAEKAEEVLTAVTLVGITEPIRWTAGMLRPAALRTLDAIHLATALSFGAELEAFVVYDRRLAEAALAAGLEVRAPGAAA